MIGETSRGDESKVGPRSRSLDFPTTFVFSLRKRIAEKKKTGPGLSHYYVKVSALFLVKVSRSVIIFMLVHETITLRSEGFT